VSAVPVPHDDQLLSPTRFGVFLAPFHGDFAASPTVMLRQDLELVDHLDRLGYEEVWVGEHHSAGWETIGSPEVFIAAAAERTRRIRLGTGVSSLPYHNPFVLADRMCQLDHQTMGRAMLGVGPGQLPSDAYIMGIDPARQRHMMAEALDVVVRLLRGEVVTARSDWFDLHDARLWMRPFSEPHLEMAVASAVTPFGARLAGRYGLGLLSFAASVPAGYNALHSNWGECEQSARAHGQSVDRRGWRIVAPVHLAPTREQAEAEVIDGVYQFAKVLEHYQAMGPVEWAASPEAALHHWRENGFTAFGMGIIGTPDDAIGRIDEFVRQSGGFGSFLILAHNTADREATLRSYDLFARYVVPHYRRANVARRASADWCHDHAQDYFPAMVKGIEEATGMAHHLPGMPSGNGM
jgi:limonene 1,2-monooxygenase